MEITVCEHGAVKFDADGRAWTLLPGTVFVSQPGVVHRLRSNVRGSILRWIFVALPRKGKSFLGLSVDDSATLAARLRALGTRLYRIPAGAQYLIEELFADYGRGAGVDEMRLVRFRTDAIRFLLSVIDSVPVQDEMRSASPIRAVIAQMRREPEKDYSIELLISETQLSETSLATAFKRETGQTPHEFLVTCRIRKAMEILAKDPSVRITSLALDLGFASSQHFAARFRRETGKTPSEWRAGN
jgi:AraC-like DNA-binding protein